MLKIFEVDCPLPFAVVTVLSAPSARAQAFINVLTGGTSGVYYPLGRRHRKNLQRPDTGR